MSHSFELQPPSPTDFQHYLSRLGQTSERALYQVGENWFGRLLRVGERLLYVRVVDQRSDGKPGWLVELPQGEPSDEEQVRASLRHLLCLDAPLHDIQALMQGEEALNGIRERFLGVRMIIDAEPWEAAAGAIISQQLNLAFAAALKQRLMELCGEGVTVDGATLRAFPSPEQVARLEPDQLRALQFSQRKAEYLIGLAREVVEGRLDLNGLGDASDEAVIARLVTLRGVGRWTAECFLLFGLGRPDLLPAADIGLRNAVRRVYGLDHQPTEGEVRAIAVNWHPWSSWITYYLWLSLAW
ncbi:MAG: DNA-3-methyladenine glycosylase family protein [Bacillota bacterium]